MLRHGFLGGKHRPPSSVYISDILTDAHDWLMLLRLTRESEYAIYPTQKPWPAMLPLAPGPAWLCA